MPVLRNRYLHIAAGAIALMAPAAGHAQNSASTPAPPPPPPPPSALAATPAAPTVEPAALAALDRMAATLRALPHFTINAAVTHETVLETGQKLQFSETLHIEAKVPTALSISVKSDARSRDYYYNGSSVTVVAPTLKYYASAPAPATIREMIAAVNEQFGLELPLSDLFLWGTDPVYVQRLQSGYLVRPQTMNGKECMQYAFRQAGVDWQVWIPTAGQPLPCKLVITDTSDSSMPQYSAVLDWNTSTPPDAKAFTFVPPAGFTKIEILEASEQAEAGGVR